MERASRFVEVLKKAAADPSNRSSIDPPLFRLSRVGVELMMPKLIEHRFMNRIFYALSFFCISRRREVSDSRNEPVDFAKRQQSSVLQLDFGSDLWISGAVVMARKNLQVSNAIFVIENLVATTVFRFLAACEFSVRSFLQPPWLVWLEPVILSAGKTLEIRERPSIPR